MLSKRPSHLRVAKLAHASASRCRARMSNDIMMVMLSAFHASPFRNAAA
jgi:hypothetical protein